RFCDPELMGLGKHIVFLSPGFPENHEDYLCIPPLQAYLPLLRAQYPDCKISVIAVHYPYKKQVYQWHDFEIRAVGGKNKRLRKPMAWRGVNQAFKALHKSQSVDVIHSLWLQECAFLGGKIAAKYKVPHVSTIMGQDALPENRYLPKLKLDAMRVVAISERAAEHFSLVSRKDVDAVIPWGIGPEDASWQPNGKERSIDVLGVGSLIGLKKYDRWLRVVSALREKNPNLRAVLVGDGPDRGRLEAMVQDLKLGKHVEFTGILPRPKVLDLMAQSKVFVHTALYEGQGYVFLEALARGMHVLSCKVGMARESDKWKLCDHTIDFVEHAKAFLAHPVDEAPRHPIAMQETVAAYAELYQSAP
ncbi:MAG: glycosyltransferase, partial [Bacteroidota bacterium]